MADLGAVTERPPACCVPTWIPSVGDNGVWVHAHNCPNQPRPEGTRSVSTLVIRRPVADGESFTINPGDRASVNGRAIGHITDVRVGDGWIVVAVDVDSDLDLADALLSPNTRDVNP
jgi:hypothetical protein